MKLLFDENLSRKLVARFAELYPDSAHVSGANLLESPDRGMTEYEIILYWSTEDDAFIAEVPRLAGCAVDDATRRSKALP